MINLHEPLLDKKDLKSLLDCYKTKWISSGGNKVKEFENKFARSLEQSMR